MKIFTIRQMHKHTQIRAKTFLSAFHFQQRVIDDEQAEMKECSPSRSASAVQSPSEQLLALISTSPHRLCLFTVSPFLSTPKCFWARPSANEPLREADFLPSLFFPRHFTVLKECDASASVFSEGKRFPLPDDSVHLSSNQACWQSLFKCDVTTWSSPIKIIILATPRSLIRGKR